MKIIKNLRGGVDHYAAPTVERLDIAVERGFALSENDIDDLPASDWVL